MDKAVQIISNNNVYGRIYQRAADVTEPLRAVPRISWVTSVLTTLADLSILKPIHSKSAMAVNALARFVVTCGKSNEIINLPAKSLTNSKIYEFMCGFETFLESEDQSENAKNTASVETLRLILVGLENFKTKEVLHRKAINFRSRFAQGKFNTGLISDVGDIKGLGVDFVPVGAISHESFLELYKEIKSRIDQDLDHIIDCCVSDIQRFANVRKEMSRLAKTHVEQDVVAFIRKCISQPKGIKKEDMERYESISAELILAAHIQILDGMTADKSILRKEAYFNKLDRAVEEVFGDMSGYFASARSTLESRYRCTGQELLSIFILLLCHTGWNPGGLIGMTRDRMEKSGSTWEVQGFKSKTDDDTPVEYLGKEHAGANEALSALDWHHKRMVTDHIIKDQTLWYTSFVPGGEVKPNVGIVPKSLFFRRHNLPKFKLIQIRNQVLEKNRLEGRSLEQVRRKAGHKDAQTTVSYLDNLVNRRMYSSINFEFSRRLEETVIFRLQEVGKLGDIDCDKGLVRESLLMPIGDGSYCTNPKTAPDSAIINDGLCSALTCHVGEGCPNRRIVIDNSSLESLIRKRKYYIDNWARLESNNPSAFREFHWESMLFVFGLYHYIFNSSYRVYIENLEERMML
ncbi:hypothetical protein thsps21_25110 [Pseudomonas sp. No.21]|nr:hypothetical protein TUM20249_27230 [Pseudomonas tohonis]